MNQSPKRQQDEQLKRRRMKKINEDYSETNYYSENEFLTSLQKRW